MFKKIDNVCFYYTSKLKKKNYRTAQKEFNLYLL